ncbi:MAG: hypothetical protein ACTMUB_04840 [cyanobacterium endosymbiont of Rhopalodia musculus]
MIRIIIKCLYWSAYVEVILAIKHLERISIGTNLSSRTQLLDPLPKADVLEQVYIFVLAITSR